MPISVTELAKRLEVAPEAILLHAMDLDFEVGDDEMIPDHLAVLIEKQETGNEINQFEHEIEEQREREIVEKQSEQTAGQKRVPHKKKKKDEIRPVPVFVKKSHDGAIILPDRCTVRDLALKIGKPIPLLLIKLKENGIIANLKQEIDYETAAIVAGDMGVKVKKEAGELSGEDLFHANLTDMLSDEEVEYLLPRPPIVSILGHVDHGKTSLLDRIRQEKVADGEAGGITQRIGAYQTEIEGKQITFLDTPGHEAFTKMRARGAKATDIAILVVAATEGLKPQSIEAINHIKAAEVPLIVALNKMDLPGVNLEMVKGQLAEQGINPEDWGGDVPCIGVSAKTGLGIDKLLETVLLMAELKNFRANPNRKAIGTVIESSVDARVGIGATILVNTGTLKKGDAFVIFDQNGKVRSMKNYEGEEILEAGPSTPVLISGFEKIPQVGNLLQVMDNEKIARKTAEEVASISHEKDLQVDKKEALSMLRDRIAEGKLELLKLIVKADSNGTLEAVVGELEKVKTDLSKIKVIHKGVGEISESDVMLASAGDKVVVGFNVEASGRIKDMAREEHVKIFNFDVIYHLIEKMQELLEGKLAQSAGEEILGILMVKQIFASNKEMAVLGGLVTTGRMRKAGKVRLFRFQDNTITGEKDRVLIGQAKINTVQKGMDAVNEMLEGNECGLKIMHPNLEFRAGDEIELFVEH